MSQVDPFNYPMPNRKDLMSLQTIHPQKDIAKTTTKKFQSSRMESNNLNTSDIHGASPKLHGSKQVNKQEFTNTNWDIARSSPAALHIGLNKPQYNLEAVDQPNCVKFSTTRIGGDPLNPKYKVPEVEQRPFTPPRYVRDHMEIDDIEGARPKKVKQNDIKTREIMKLDDIEGTKATIRHQARQRSNGFDAYDYSDITKAQFVTMRSTNPLNPTYQTRDDNGNLIEIGDVAGSRPQGMPAPRQDPRIIASLRTEDITGAKASTKGLGVFSENHDRKDYRQTNKTDDIEGAKSGSLRKGPATNRISNPLDPDYQIPGSKELGEQNPYSQTKNTLTQSQKNFGRSTQQQTAQQTFNKPGPLSNIPEYKQEKFKEDYIKFYGVDERQAQKLDFNKLYQASKEGRGITQPVLLPSEVKGHPDFNKNHRKFYGIDNADTKSEFNRNAAKFYGDDPNRTQPKLVNTNNTIGDKFLNVQTNIEVNPSSEHYQKNAAVFYGDQYEVKSQGSIYQKNKANFFGTDYNKNDSKLLPAKQTNQNQGPQVNVTSGHFKKDAGKFYGMDHVSETESQGSVFQKNAANFYGMEAPPQGERPFKIQKVIPNHQPGENQKQVVSVLNEQKLREHEQQIMKDPNYAKNQKRFFGLPSHHTVQRSASSVQKFDQFIKR
ncbi:UNKNOWN [Stylonychia lemnae]|uniref:Uncharacterized protein n=1 Tax=Stylonychia lemnae TaxID=5949 RepID=A0A078A9K8_STYLE|nr:UNKNOWN [Stylonychia lemnae]|eukprot:CDW78556.1 UNKNOWN [Stylonychia lemnae]